MNVEIRIIEDWPPVEPNGHGGKGNPKMNSTIKKSVFRHKQCEDWNKTEITEE